VNGRITPPYWCGLYGPRNWSAIVQTKLPRLLKCRALDRDVDVYAREAFPVAVLCQLLHVPPRAGKRVGVEQRVVRLAAVEDERLNE